LIFTVHQEAQRLAQRREAREAREEEAEEAGEAAKVAEGGKVVAAAEVETMTAAHTRYVILTSRSVQVFLFKRLLAYVVIWCVSF